jgi:hypothetical protein
MRTFLSNWNKLQTTDVIAWPKESRSLLDTIYNNGGAKVKDDYVDASAITIQTQIHKASIQLTTLLNSTFNPQQELQFSEVLEELRQTFELTGNYPRTSELE